MIDSDRVKDELDKIATALRETPAGEKWNLLHAAQQALSWANEPKEAMAPFDYIQRINSKDIPEETKDCREHSHPVPF